MECLVAGNGALLAMTPFTLKSWQCSAWWVYIYADSRVRVVCANGTFYPAAVVVLVSKKSCWYRPLFIVLHFTFYSRQCLVCVKLCTDFPAFAVWANWDNSSTVFVLISRESWGWIAACAWRT